MATTNNEKTENQPSIVSLANNSDSFRERFQALGGRLLQRLQTTLELEEILALFAEEVRQIVNFQSFEYRLEGLSLFPVREEGAGRHEVDYSLTLQGRDLGAVLLRRSYRFKEVEMEALETLIGSLVYPLRNALMYREAQRAALTDALTGVANKRALDYQLPRELKIAQRYQQDISLLMLDIDYFKSINDTYGHAGGDLVLQRVAQQIQKCCRGADTLFRYGGEEFAVILPTASIGDAFVIAERIRSAVTEMNCPIAGNRVSVSVSIGCATYHPNESAMTLIERADAALYQAKRNGRNRTCIAAADESGLAPRSTHALGA